jgi:hypothetical protein
MGFDLTSDSGQEFQLRTSAWTFFLYLAEAYGWTKEGTQPPPGVAAREWDGLYASNDGQRVAAADGQKLADAFERLLADADRTERAREVGRQIAKDVRELARRDGIELPESEDEDHGIDEEALRELVAFCRAGAFRID